MRSLSLFPPSNSNLDNKNNIKHTHLGFKIPSLWLPKQTRINRPKSNEMEVFIHLLFLWKYSSDLQFHLGRCPAVIHRRKL